MNKIQAVLYAQPRRAVSPYRLTLGFRAGELGNISYLRDEFPQALERFEAALAMEPADTTALLGTAMAQYQLNEHGAAAASYAQLSAQDKELASRYAWLANGPGTRDNRRDRGPKPIHHSQWHRHLLD